jgi:hypothetical protein
MTTNQRHTILAQAIDESLHSLGDPIKKTVVWHLNLNGIFIESEQFDIASFYATLEDIMGSSAEVVLHIIHGILAKNQDFRLSKDPHLSVLDRIRDTMKTDGGTESK